MDRKRKLLDVFCGAGGAAMGYYRAGFTEIVGIDIKSQPNYPFDFVRMDFVDLFTYPYPLFEPLILCGTMFPGLRVLRHRLFEFSYSIIARGAKPKAPAHPKHPLVHTKDKRKSHYGKLDERSAFVGVNGGGNCSVEVAREAMGIDWMTKAELNEAIPPAYTEWIGKQLIAFFDFRDRQQP